MFASEELHRKIPQRELFRSDDPFGNSSGLSITARFRRYSRKMRAIFGQRPLRFVFRRQHGFHVRQRHELVRGRLVHPEDHQ